MEHKEQEIIKQFKYNKMKYKEMIKSKLNKNKKI
jgi:hypothetical protein